MTTIDVREAPQATTMPPSPTGRTRGEIQRAARRGITASVGATTVSHASVRNAPGAAAIASPTRAELQRRRRRAHRTDDAASARSGAVDMVLATLAAVVVVAALGAFAWQATGGRILMMSTQSMCPETCVGALVVDRAASGPYRVGEMISFNPPGSTAVYTHRIISVDHGVLRTKGDANLAADPWTLTGANVVGRTWFTLWGAGWLYKILPFLVIGIVSAAFVRPRLRRANRTAYLMAWLTAVAILPALLARPFARGALLNAVTDPGHKGWVIARLVNTGLLPTRMAFVRGQSQSWVAPSRIVQLSGPQGKNGYLPVVQWVVLPWWGWGIVAVVVLSPLLIHSAHSLTTSARPARATGQSRP